MSPEDRRRMALVGRSLAGIERDAAPGHDAELAAVEAADRDRVRRGKPPLEIDATRPEEEFYRRARALGFRRSGC